jgi:NAD(P)-dependent dehydrogenase (short-subunit alcohol dehydrogenase family)
MSELRFDGRVAIVTGGGRGIGKANALALAKRGAGVVINDLGCDGFGRGSDPNIAEAVAEEIRQAGGKAVAQCADIGAPDVAEELTGLALSEFGRVDIVLSNAMFERLAPFYEISREEVQAHLNTDVFGAWSLLKAVWPHFEKQNYGRVLISVSSSLLGGGTGGVPYAMCKGALVSFNRSLANIARVGNLDIKSNVIAPYAFTQMWEAMPSVVPDEAVRDATRRYLPPDGIAPTALALTHESCPASGQIFVCANGKVQRFFYAKSPGIEAADLTPELIIENFDKLESPDGWEEVIGVSMQTGTPFMARAIEVVSGKG